jgi:uncharacterized protein YaiE (UPF0345 family)
MITVNEYFEGNVKSLGYHSSEGNSTVGVIDQGEYKFGTSTDETMIIIEGQMEVLLPEADKWITVKSGDEFKVPANTSFEVKSDGQTSYLCKYK